MNLSFFLPAIGKQLSLRTIDCLGNQKWIGRVKSIYEDFIVLQLEDDSQIVAPVSGITEFALTNDRWSKLVPGPDAEIGAFSYTKYLDLLVANEIEVSVYANPVYSVGGVKSEFYQIVCEHDNENGVLILSERTALPVNRIGCIRHYATMPADILVLAKKVAKK